MGSVEVIALLMPERGPSGANTTISPKSLKHAASSLMPFAATPSSFVIKINGLSFVIVYSP